MRFKWLDSKALILKSGKDLVTSLVAAAVVTAVGFAIGSATLASAQDLSRRSSARDKIPVDCRDGRSSPAADPPHCPSGARSG